MEKLIKDILNKENIQYKLIKKATSGFTNLVYFVDENFVIKISSEEATKKKLDKEASIYQNIQLSCIPKFIAYGSFKEYKYLIITKIKGNSLYSVWHSLTSQQRKKCVSQIAQILQSFNKQNYDFLSDEYKDLNWVEYMTSELKSKSTSLKEMGYNTEHLDLFISKNLSDLFANNNFGLVYNDAHFDNFIYDVGKLFLIDFDRVRVCPIDFEMMIFKTMCDNPSKFASEEDEEKIKETDYIDIYHQFQSHYPEMFENKNTEIRIKVYQFNYLIGQAIKCRDNELITKLLLNF